MILKPNACWNLDIPFGPRQDAGMKVFLLPRKTCSVLLGTILYGQTPKI